MSGGLGEFLAMGGYAFYVWTSYLVFVLVLAWDGLVPAWRGRRLLRELARRQQRESAAEARKMRKQAP
jgi:heme exporter protein D